MSKHQVSSSGEDSFLDIVANLVGILIILVVIVGAQAAAAWQQKEPDNTDSARFDQVNSQTVARAAEATNLQMENAELHQKIDYEKTITNRLSENRHQLLLAIETAKRELDAQQQLLNEDQRTSYETESKIQELKHKIQQVRYEFAAVEHQSKPAIETIEHYPTPIAKTVFSDEIHFRILGGRIVHVPLEELVQAMKNEWKVNAKKLEHAENTWETVGPIGNFRLQYLLSVVAAESHGQSRQRIQFQRFLLQPISQYSGEPIDVAMQPGSDFVSRINLMIPGKTTVSLWVYPDGYDDLIAVRNWLRVSGFQTASWPLKFNQPISGGPQGFRTTTN